MKTKILLMAFSLIYFIFINNLNAQNEIPIIEESLRDAEIIDPIEDTIAISEQMETDDRVICKTCPEYNFSISPTASWKTHSSSIVSNGCKIYKISVTPGRIYIFKTGCGNGATASFDTYLKILSSNCYLLAENDDGCEEGRSYVEYNSASGYGTIYLVVSGWNSYSYGSFKLAYRYETVCSTCPDYNYTISPTTYWKTASGGHDEYGCQVYKMYLNAGKFYTFKTGCGNGATATYNTYIKVYNNGCQYFCGNDNGCESNRSLVNFYMGYTGYVYVKVMGVGASHGSYTLAYKYSYSDRSELQTDIENYTLDNSINLYPNPTKNAFTIELNDNQSISAVQLLDLTGRVVHDWNIESNNNVQTFNISGYL
ncbi:MAG: T9SS type A sorting domain-containing protein [Bacteroidetes bacterium]|nr:T9SS type A sorting domain-containing protein [Bacteroidota bacterium]